MWKVSGVLMDEPLYAVKLTSSELRLLNGSCRPEVQVVVDSAMRAGRYALSLTPKQAAFVAKVMDEAESAKRLVWYGKSIRVCDVCGESAGYGVYKSGRNRGRLNYDKPHYLSGVELAERFVTMQGYTSVGACTKCVDAVLATLQAELRDVPCELPDILRAEGAPKWKRWKTATCADCGWNGHEGQMGLLPAVMGGQYRGQCPKCKAENTWLGRTIVETLSSEYVVVREETGT